ncbi:hypothetical protein [Streptomyces sp. NBC_01353]|uniref:hypothetical protein n=1 Tax=Streptomyces sp. NBC_01353 TaxID=2903835 RepID=UPI002E336726|nr:hypothetical protein [Streptomyces sp. NBC_01353]
MQDLIDRIPLDDARLFEGFPDASGAVGRLIKELRGADAEAKAEGLLARGQERGVLDFQN